MRGGEGERGMRRGEGHVRGGGGEGHEERGGACEGGRGERGRGA